VAFGQSTNPLRWFTIGCLLADELLWSMSLSRIACLAASRQRSNLPHAVDRVAHRVKAIEIIEHAAVSHRSI
jgi:hypothetical protein